MKQIEIHLAEFFVIRLSERVQDNFVHVGATMTNTLERRKAQVSTQVLSTENTPTVGEMKQVKILLLWKLHKQLKRAIIDPSLNSSKQMTPAEYTISYPSDCRYGSTYTQHRQECFPQEACTRDIWQTVGRCPRHLPNTA